MRKTKIVYLDGSLECELVIPQELLFDSEKKEKFIKDHIGNIDYTEHRYYDESDEDIDILPEQISDDTDNTSENSAPVSELPPTITEVPDSEPPSLDLLTVEIKFHLNQVGYHVIEVGKRLIQAKELVPYGEWQNWLKNNFNLSMQTARKFMQISERLGIVRDVARFQSSQLIELLSLPTGEEQNFLALKDAEGTPADQMTVKQLRSEVKKFKDAGEHLQKKASELEGKLAAAESTLDAKNKYISEIKTIADSLEEQNSNLKAKLEQRPIVEITPPDYEDLQREVKELRDRPIEVATEFPPDYESTKKENAELKARELSFKHDYALAQNLNQIFSLLHTLINADNLKNVVNICADEGIENLEYQLSQLLSLHDTILNYVTDWENDPINQRPIDRDSIISELKQIMLQDSSTRTSSKIEDLISSLGYKKLLDIPDDFLPDLLKKVRNFKRV